MKYRPSIAAADFDVKTRKVAEFLVAGERVRVTVMLRGREVGRPERGVAVAERVAAAVVGVGRVESGPTVAGRDVVMVLRPHGGMAAAKARRRPPAQPRRASIEA